MDRLANTWARKWRRPLPVAPWTKALMSRGRARTVSCGPEGKGVGGGQVGENESTGRTVLLAETTVSWRARMVVQTDGETVRFERIIAARSARIAEGFWGGLGARKEKERRDERRHRRQEKRENEALRGQGWRWRSLRG